MNIQRASNKPNLHAPAAGGAAGTLLRRYLTAISLLGILLFGGIKIPIVGTLYACEIGMALCFIGFVAFSSEARACLRPYRKQLLFGCLFVGAFVALDVINHNEYAYFWRGFGRNLGTLISFGTGLLILSRFGLKMFLLAASMVLLGIPLYMFAVGDSNVYNVSFFVKYYYGFYLINVALFAVRRSKLVTGCVLAAYSVALYSVCDFRSGAAYVAGVLLWMIAFPVLKHVRPVFTFVILSIVIPVVVVESVAASIRLADVGSSELRRREDSDDERLQMAYDAVDHIKERPLTGYGSWQQVMLFQSSLNNNDALDGVHSIPLQLGFEYGITGLILSGLFLIGLVSVSTGFAYYVDRTRTIAPEFVPSCMLWLITSIGNYFFGALMGLGRISVGFEMALVAWMGTQLLMTRHQRTHARASLRMGWKPARQPV